MNRDISTFHSLRTYEVMPRDAVIVGVEFGNGLGEPDHIDFEAGVV